MNREGRGDQAAFSSDVARSRRRTRFDVFIASMLRLGQRARAFTVVRVLASASRSVEATLSGRGAGGSGRTFENPLERDGDQRADDRSRNIHTGCTQIASKKIGRERTDGIH